MSSFFGSDGSFVLQFAVIFVVILAILTAGVLVVRRLGGGGGLSARPSQRSRQPRLGIVDVYELDRQRQLILLRRDNVEHLLLVGGPNDVVIERNIQRGHRLAEPALRADAVEPQAELPAEIEARRPEPTLFEETLEPAFAMPAVVPAPAPAPISAPVPMPVPPQPAREAAEFMPEAPPEPEPAPPAPAESPRRFLRRSSPPLVNPKPDVASERVRSEPTFGPSDAPARPQAAAAPPVAAPPIPAPTRSRAVDAAILSDMARQLEIALARPASAVTPPPANAPVAAAPAAAPSAAPAPEEHAAAEKPVDPMAAAMAAAPAVEEPPAPQAQAFVSEAPVPAAAATSEPFLPEPPPARTELVARIAEVPEDLLPPPVEPAAKPEPKSAAPRSAEPRSPAPKPAETPAPAPSAPASPVPPAQTPAQTPAKESPTPAKSAPNPFSVEEIEAEFARLLGRPLEKRQ